MLASKIEDVNVPQDFVKSYDVKYTSIEDIQLSKNDDKSVNSGKDVDLLKDLEGIEGEKEELENIRKSMNNETLSRCKNDLIVLMSRIKGGYTPTTEEKMVLHETKALYNSLGGDSYVDDMFNSLRKEGKI